MHHTCSFVCPRHPRLGRLAGIASMHTVEHSMAKWQMVTCLSAVQSEVVMVDLAQGRVVRRLKGIGTKSHGLVWWQDSLLMLDSDGGALIRVHPSDGSWTSLYKVLCRHDCPPPVYLLPVAFRAVPN